jgi:hypothetical protein
VAAAATPALKKPNESLQQPGEPPHHTHPLTWRNQQHLLHVAPHNPHLLLLLLVEMYLVCLQRAAEHGPPLPAAAAAADARRQLNLGHLASLKLQQPPAPRVNAAAAAAVAAAVCDLCLSAVVSRAVTMLLHYSQHCCRCHFYHHFDQQQQQGCHHPQRGCQLPRLLHALQLPPEQQQQQQ